MSRIVILITIAVILSPLAFACEMKLSERAPTVSGYFADGQDCLDSPPGTFRFDEFIEQRFMAEINRERTERGLSRLAARLDMRPAARFHSLDMGVNNYFGHSSPHGRVHADRLAAFDRTLLAEGSAENLAQFGPARCVDQFNIEVSCGLVPNFRPPSEDMVVSDLHQKLMDSPGHRDNILDPEMTHMAIGVARTDTGFYVTQLFANQLGILAEPAPLTVEAGETLEAEAKIPNWSVAGLALSVNEEIMDLHKGKVPAKFSGDFGLSIRAETTQEFEERRSKRTVTTWIYAAGPTIEVVAPTGS